MRYPWFASLVLVLVSACGGDSGNNPDGGSAAIDADPTAPDAGPPPMTNDGGMPLCLEGGAYVVCECADGVDNDLDGEIDAGADLECSGPYDNDESSFATGIPGDNMDPFAQDCFFDGDSGGGNDGCRWDIRCEDPPDGQHCQNNDTSGCDFCRGLTPNGCDCFGCCDVYVDLDGDMTTTPDEIFRVRIVDTCTADVIADPALCPPCEFVTDCYNPCDPCEHCIGHDPEPGCTEGPCEDGVVPCDADGACPDGTGCVTGCCQPIVE
jgi:hypothetical protein